MKRRNFLKFAAVSGAAALPSALNAASQNADKISQNKTTMKRFEKAINSADAATLKELVDPKVPFLTPASPEPLYGGEGYFAVVKMMRDSFPDVQWRCKTWWRTSAAWRCIGFARVRMSMTLRALRLLGVNLALG